MTGEQKPLEILVIDDSIVIRELLKAAIGPTGANVTTAVDGQEGIGKYVKMYEAKTPYGAVFTDLNMPNATGVDVTRRVKELSPKTPVYIITGEEASAEYRRLAAELGELKPDGVIQKPFRIQEIRDLVGKIRAQISTENTQPYRPPNPNQL